MKTDLILSVLAFLVFLLTNDVVADTLPLDRNINLKAVATGGSTPYSVNSDFVKGSNYSEIENSEALSDDNEDSDSTDEENPDDSDVSQESDEGGDATPELENPLELGSYNYSGNLFGFEDPNSGIAQVYDADGNVAMEMTFDDTWGVYNDTSSNLALYKSNPDDPSEQVHVGVDGPYVVIWHSRQSGYPLCFYNGVPKPGWQGSATTEWAQSVVDSLNIPSEYVAPSNY